MSRSLERGDHTLEVSRPSVALELRPQSPLADCAYSHNRSAKEVGLEVRRIPGGVRLSAGAHSACVKTAIPNAVAGGSYTLGVDVRTASGARARLCVWQIGPSKCAEISGLPGDNTWRRYRTTFTLDPATQGARIYLYADGQDHARTVTEYRNLELRPVAPDIVEIAPRDVPPSPSPRVTWSEPGSGSVDVRVRVRVRVHGPARGRLLVVNESFASGWQLGGAKAASHVVANGYANGWILDTAKPAAVTARFTPSRYAILALIASILTALVGVAFALYQRRRSRRSAITRRLRDLDAQGMFGRG
jgi:arabinofuranan 3-O-arabinosyltransferase